MSTCHVFAGDDHGDPDSRPCTEEDGGETVVFHTATTRIESGALLCGSCGLRDDQVDDLDVIVRPLPNGQWETLSPTNPKVSTLLGV